MNTYYKYAPNVFLAKCTDKHEKGDIIEVTTSKGKVNEHYVHNLVAEKNGLFYYSITRVDGYNVQERAKKKAEKYLGYSANAENKSQEYFDKSNKDRDFLSLGEPIKVGHHSERRHRKIIEQAHNNMGKCVELDNKSKEYANKAAYWESMADTINLSMPESLDYYRFKLDEAVEYHEGLKTGKYERDHSYSLTYAKKKVNELQKLFDQANKLWK